MDYSDIIVFTLEILGTIAFASSGAMLAIQKKMDVFGVIVLGITTAVGGGLIRDLILGVTPPVMFQNPDYAITAVVTSVILFLIMYKWKRYFSGKVLAMYDFIMALCDTVGLGIFTVMGANAAIQAGYENHHFLIIFVGVLTGVGGGVMRDVMAGSMPFIFVKHVYAVASLAGAVMYAYLAPDVPRLYGMFASSALVIVLRVLAAHYHWNLPHVE